MYGSINVKVQVDTDGRAAVSLKHIFGRVSGKPKVGTSVHPVRIMKTSLRVGVLGGHSVRVNKMI